MQTIGLLGGMSWESTREYYRLLNEGVREVKGGLHSAPILMHSFDFAQIAQLQHAGRWDALADMLSMAAQGLERAGAGAIMICTNLMHKVAPQVQASINIPLLHIADAVAAAIKADGIDCVALLGARYTMLEPFYRDKLSTHGIRTIVPEAPDLEEISRVVYDELCQGRFLTESRRFYGQAIERLVARGARGVVLGCTEIPQLISPKDVRVPMYDTTALHAEAGLAFVLSPAPAPVAA